MGSHYLWRIMPAENAHFAYGSLKQTCWPSFRKGYLEGHPMTCKWLITMVIVGKSPKDRVVYNPFQMAELHGL